VIRNSILILLVVVLFSSCETFRIMPVHEKAIIVVSAAWFSYVAVQMVNAAMVDEINAGE
jgi:hypothetical protein